MFKYRKPHIPNFKKYADAFQAAAVGIATAEVGTFAKREKEKFVNRIENQKFKSFDAHPLSPRYAAWKKKKGLDPRIMIATGWYKSRIRLFKHHLPGTRKTVFKIGFWKTERAHDHEDNPIPIRLSTIAMIHEHGSAKMNIPPRPHWGPHYKDMRKLAPVVCMRIRRRIMARMKQRFPKVKHG